jgi:hypothetical protein
VPYREGDGGWFKELQEDWQLWWQRRRRG